VPFLLRVHELSPQNTPAWVKLAQAFMAVNHLAEARKEASAILQQDPANSDALLTLADSSRSKEEIAAGEEQVQKFPNKNTAASHLASASLAMRKGDLGRASDEIQQAVAIEPNSARAHLVLAVVYLMRENRSHAEEEMKTAAGFASPRSEERIKYAEFQAPTRAADAAKATLQNGGGKA